MVIDLPKVQAEALYRLVARHAFRCNSSWWARIAQKIRLDLDTQAGGGFFQCSACTDEKRQNANKT